MNVKQFKLHNIGRFQHLNVPLAPTENSAGNVTIFIGNNGSGKTSLLNSLATSLSWLVSRLRTEKGSGSPIVETVIKNGANSSAIDVDLTYKNDNSEQEISWRLAKTRQGRVGDYRTKLDQVTQLCRHFRESLSENDQLSLPLISFYPVERVVLDIPLKIRGKHHFMQMDGYDNSLSQGVDFRRFFEWFREREDSENEPGIYDDVVNRLKKLWNDHDLEKDEFLKVVDGILKQHKLSRGLQLNAVRNAISHFMPGFNNLRVRRKPHLHMSIDKNNETLNVLQLSQGEKSLMVLVGDIARRLAMMNPALENPLHGDGIVLIDEVDMHLHPQWQRSLVARLTQTFPNIQFILTTHSPLVISDDKTSLVYLLDGDELRPYDELYGEDVNSVLLEVMDTAIRNEVVDERLGDLLDAIQDRLFTTARALLEKLKKDLPDSNIELIKAQLLLRKQELRSAVSVRG